MSKTKKRLFIIASCIAVIAIGAVSLGAAGVGGNKGNAEAAVETDARLAVETSTPSLEDIVIKGEYIGTVDPSRSVTVYPKASGEILSVNYEAGDTVEAGAVLCELDSKALSASIAQMETALASAQAKANYNLAMAEKDLATAEYNTEHGFEANVIAAEGVVSNAQAGVESARIRLRAAEVSASTARRTLADLRDGELDIIIAAQGLSYEQAEKQYIDAVRQAELNVDTADVALETAKSGLEQAKESLKALKVISEEQRISAVDRVRVSELNANLKDQYIALDKLKDDLKNYSVTSSISGIVEKRNVEPFDMASPQTPLFVIVDKETMTVAFNVSETSLASMRVGDKITLDKNGKTYDGKISEIATSVDDRSGLFAVEATVENPPSELYGGTSVKIFADAKKATNSLLIPIDTIYYEGGKPFVYIADNGTAKKVFIETGISDDERIQVLSGLTANDAIITTWNPNLTNGAAIKLAAEGE